MLKRSLLIASLVLFASAPGYTWTNEKNFAEIVDSFMNHNSDDLIISWGTPTSEYKLNSGGKVLTYVFDLGSSGSVVPIARMYSVASNNLTCKVNFSLNSSNTIISSSIQGNSCKAKRSKMLKEWHKKMDKK